MCGYNLYESKHDLRATDRMPDPDNRNIKLRESHVADYCRPNKIAAASSFFTLFENKYNLIITSIKDTKTLKNSTSRFTEAIEIKARLPRVNCIPIRLCLHNISQSGSSAYTVSNLWRSCLRLCSVNVDRRALCHVRPKSDTTTILDILCQLFMEHTSSASYLLRNNITNSLLYNNLSSISVKNVPSLFSTAANRKPCLPGSLNFVNPFQRRTDFKYSFR